MQSTAGANGSVIEAIERSEHHLETTGSSAGKHRQINTGRTVNVDRNAKVGSAHGEQ